MAYYLAYLDSYPYEVVISKYANKDDLIAGLMDGINPDLYGSIHKTLAECKQEAAMLLDTTIEAVTRCTHIHRG